MNPDFPNIDSKQLSAYPALGADSKNSDPNRQAASKNRSSFSQTARSTFERLTRCFFEGPSNFIGQDQSVTKRLNGRSESNSRRGNAAYNTSDIHPLVQNRASYVVKSGESIGSIALYQLGDERFADLITTINRGQIDFSIESGDIIASVYPGLRLNLPSAQEMEIHRRIYFASKAENRQTFKSTKSVKSVQTRLISKLTEIVEVASQKLITPEQIYLEAGGCSYTMLSNYCRIAAHYIGETEYSITLESQTECQWLTIASYNCHNGLTTRQLNRSDGSTKQMELGLPAEVARALAVEDFSRNWKFYCGRFKNIRLHGSTPGL